jgi:hypothetical protein
MPTPESWLLQTALLKRMWRTRPFAPITSIGSTRLQSGFRPYASDDPTSFPWRNTFPGNVRELEHLMERVAVQAGGRAITAEQLLDTTSRRNTDLELETLLQLTFHESAPKKGVSLSTHSMHPTETNPMLRVA